MRASGTGWIVNRFVCPASKLAELGDEPLRLSLVLDTRELPPADPRIEAVEAAGLDPELLFDAAPEVYFELPLRDDISFRSEQRRVDGYLLLPPGQARRPAVVFAHGSGGDRRERR